MIMPVRVQRKRTKGYKLPENTKCVNRGTRWGNPYKVSEHGRQEAIELYKVHLDEKLSNGELKIDELRGKNLACFCGLDEACHADILLELLTKK